MSKKFVAFVVFLLPFFSLAADVSPVIGIPTTKEKVTCTTITSTKVAGTDALPQLSKIETVAEREFWSIDDVTWFKTRGQVVIRDSNNQIVREYSYTSNREMRIEEAGNGIEIERSVIRYKADDRAEQTWIQAHHFQLVDGERRLIRSFQDGVEVPDHSLASTTHTLVDGRVVSTYVGKPRTERTGDGLSYEILREESTCLTEGL